MKKESPVSRFVKSFKDYGFAETVLKVLHRLRIISVHHTFEFIFKELEATYPSAFQEMVVNINGNENVFIREIKEYELDALDFVDGMYSLDTFRAHFSKGMRFFAAFYNNQVVSVNGAHMTHANLVYIGMPNIALPKDLAYINCALTSPKFRSLSIGTKLRDFALSIVQKDGINWIFGAVFIENKKAMVWNLRNGFQYWGRISYIQLLGRNFWFRRLSPAGRRCRFLFDRVEKMESATLFMEKAL